MTDPSGAAVAAAEVRLTNTGTAQTDQVTTNDAGLFTFQNVIAGTYDLAMIARGFSVSKEQGIPVNANTLQRRDVALQLGALAETVSVEASAVTLQTDSAAVSSEITTKELTNIPMGQYRNYQSMELLVPGATPPRFQSARTDTPQRTLTVNMNGTDRQSNTTKIDGTVSMNIVTDAFDAEQGGTGGAAITVTTKSGTNAIHGSLYENLENSILGARDFFNPGKVTPKEILNNRGCHRCGPDQEGQTVLFLRIRDEPGAGRRRHDPDSPHSGSARRQGLLGARYYVEHPLYPLKQTVANINLDCFSNWGWGATRDFSIVGIGNSTLDDLTAAAVRRQGRVLTGDTAPEQGFYFRSDHFEFARVGIPSLETSPGIDYAGKPAGYGVQKRNEYIGKDYHQPSDVAKPDWDLRGAVQDLRILLEVGYEAAQQDGRPQWKPDAVWRPKAE